MATPDIRREPGQPTCATWLLDVPDAHPAWRQYMVSLADLTTPTVYPPVIHAPGMTHEVVLAALDPRSPVDVARPAGAQATAICPLTPWNLAVQFPAPTWEVALSRIQAMVDAIESRRLHPDTDFAQHWELGFFPDGVSLRRVLGERQ